MDDLPRQLLSDWNDYSSRTTHRKSLAHPTKPRTATAANIATLNRLIDWCRERELDPRMWLYSLFATRHWAFAPLFKDAYLCSEKHVARFKAGRWNARYFQNRVQSEVDVSRLHAETDYDPNRDVSSTVEAQKRKFLDAGQPSACLDAMDSTLGFHPQSFVCARCPEAARCAQTLQARVSFDIGALRRGDITSAQARAMAVLHGPRS